MELEDRVLELEKDFAGIDHGRFERIEEQNKEIFSKVNKMVENTGRMDERLETVEKACGKHETDISGIKQDKAKQEGGFSMLKWIIPVSIAATGIIVSLLTWGVDKLMR